MSNHETTPLPEIDRLANTIHAETCTEAVDGCDGACDRAAQALLTAKNYTCPTACLERNHPGREHEGWLRGQREWLCDVYDEPTTCLAARAPLDAICRPCRARAADRMLDALMTNTPGITSESGDAQ